MAAPRVSWELKNHAYRFAMADGSSPSTASPPGGAVLLSEGQLAADAESENFFREFQHWYESTYECRVCSSRLYKIVFPEGRELRIRTNTPGAEEVRVKRVFTCVSCARYVTSAASQNDVEVANHRALRTNERVLLGTLGDANNFEYECASRDEYVQLLQRLDGWGTMRGRPDAGYIPFDPRSVAGTEPSVQQGQLPLRQPSGAGEVPGRQESSTIAPDSGGPRKPTESRPSRAHSARKWWIGLGVIAVLILMFHGPILDRLVQSTAITGYGYCGGFDACLKQSTEAMVRVRELVGEDLAKDCLAAHQIVVAELGSGEQYSEARQGFCAATGAVVNEGLGVTFWTFPWNLRRSS